MDSSKKIPQEIIGEIINHLSIDIEMLKSCATASRPLYPASRQHIFSTIHLYNVSKVQSLHQLLEFSPEISSLVHTLYVLPFRTESLLSTVLPKLSKLQHLSIGPKGFGTSWRSIPAAAKNALEELIKSPTLCTLELKVIFQLPISVFSLANRVKTLNIYLVVLAISDMGYPDPDGTNNIELLAESIKFIDFVRGKLGLPRHAMPSLLHVRRQSSTKSSPHTEDRCLGGRFD
ncbi:hypothetical protein BDZ94DRAFT_1003144 [Collybia nuda]|uniref:Uncharacterized protein n=1 Tax=Collybia nuda TaxID=64659 RepID=A0A9P5XZL1_9AGAR|nr:hypothetical protein BDZ94DRAFT_1003144 [Collybia nuda]